MSQAVDWSDLRRADWPATLKLGVARGVISGLMIGLVLATAIPESELSTEPAMLLLAAPIYTTIGAPILFLTVNAFKLGFSAAGLGIGVLSAQIFLILISVCLIAADPVIYIINRMRPDIFNLMDFGPINLSPFIIIMHQK